MLCLFFYLEKKCMLNTIKTAKINKKAQKGGKDYE